MKKNHLALLLIATLSLTVAGALFACPSMAADDDYVAPAFYVDFNDKESIASCFDVLGCVGTHNSQEQAMQILFADNQNGYCFDPYMNLALPEGSVDLAKYHYMALLVKTNDTSRGGQMRLRSSTTADQYPFFNFKYKDTDDWQVVVIDLTSHATVGAYPPSMELGGTLTNLRLDMFDNFCDPGVQYYLKAYGLYENREDAESFIHFESEVSNEPVLPDIDYSSFWRGEGFASPANAHRMNWVAYGFNNTYRAQVDALLGQGYGGIVSNVNFNQQYLKDESEFTLLRDTYLYGKQNDMTLWIYDEYQWPSGSAYGQVLDTDASWRATGIEHFQLALDKAKYTYTPREGIDLEIKLATVRSAGKTWTPEPDGASLSFDLTGEIKGECLLDIYVLRYTDEHEQDRTDFTTLHHVDLLRPEAVARFIELTHKHYKDSFGEDFSMVEAFFTDEPGLGNRDMENYIVWTEGLDVKFKETYGYELQLPLLFEGRDEDAQRMRIHYYSLVADLFKTSYIDQISAWCEANGTASSGHLLFEENMNDHVETYGGDFMQIIGGMTIPGADTLWVHPNQLLSECFIGNHMGLRFVASAARNAGKSEVMLEYNPSAVSTEDFQNDKMGASIGGATLTRLFGSTVYNVINPQYDYTYDQINQLNTYIGRLNTVLDGTIEAGDLAVFYPIATVQALHNADDVHSSAHGENTAAVELNRNYTQFCLDLLQKQVLYTVIDDQSICAATVTEDGRLAIGNGSYRTLVLAYGEYISAGAAEKLAQFKEAGGNVVFVVTGYEDYKAIDANDNERVIAAMEKLSDCDQFKQTVAATRISKMATRTLKLTALDTLNTKNVLYGDFIDTEHDIAFVANSTALDGKATLAFTDGYDGAYTVYYPYSGLIVSGSGNEVDIDLPAYCAVLIVREDKNEIENVPAQTEPAETTPPETEPGEQTTPEDGEQTTEDTANEGGCKSAIGAIPVIAAAAACAVIVSKKKRK